MLEASSSGAGPGSGASGAGAGVAAALQVWRLEAVEHLPAGTAEAAASEAALDQARPGVPATNPKLSSMLVLMMEKHLLGKIHAIFHMEPSWRLVLGGAA